MSTIPRTALQANLAKFGREDILADGPCAHAPSYFLVLTSQQQVHVLTRVRGYHVLDDVAGLKSYLGQSLRIATDWMDAISTADDGYIVETGDGKFAVSINQGTGRPSGCECLRANGEPGSPAPHQSCPHQDAVELWLVSFS